MTYQLALFVGTTTLDGSPQRIPALIYSPDSQAVTANPEGFLEILVAAGFERTEPPISVADDPRVPPAATVRIGEDGVRVVIPRVASANGVLVDEPNPAACYAGGLLGGSRRLR